MFFYITNYSTMPPNGSSTDPKLVGKRLLVINACGPTKAFAFRVLKELGIHLIVANQTPASRIQQYVDEWILTDVYDHDQTIQAIQDYTDQGNTIDGVLTFWEESVLLTSKIIDKFSLIGIPYKIAAALKDKHTFKKDFGSPIYNKSIKLHTQEDIKQISQEL